MIGKRQNTNYGHIGFAVSGVGITCTVIGHYAEVWLAGFPIAVLGALVAAMIFQE